MKQRLTGLTFLFRLRAFVLAWLLAAGAVSLHGQSSEALMFKHLTTSDGLSNNSVRSMVRDNLGFLWVATESGLNRYDGYSFKVFTHQNSSLQNDNIRDVFIGPKGNVWVRTDMGYSVYLTEKGEFTNNYRQVLSELNLPAKEITALHGTRDNEMIAVGNKKFFLYQADGSIKSFPLLDKPLNNISLGKQQVYVSYLDGTLTQINRHTSQSAEIGVPDPYRSLLATYPFYVYADLSDGIWLHTYSNSLLLHRDEVTLKWSLTDFDNSNHTSYNRVHKLMDVGNGNICILTTHRGLVMYNTSSRQFVNYTHRPLKPHTLASNNLSSVYVDRDKTVWIGNFKHGISYFGASTQGVLSTRFLDFDDIRVFSPDLNDPDCIYFGTDGQGLIHHSLVTGETRRISTPANVVIDMSLDKQGGLWLASYQRGLSYWKDGVSKQYTTANSGLLENDIFSVKVDKRGNVWVGALHGCFQRLDPRTQHFDTVFYRPGEMVVQDLYYDERSDKVYGATNNGLLVIDADNCNYQLISDYDHFHTVDLMTVFKDSRGLVWIGTSNGLSIWNEETDEVRFIGTEDGLPANLVRAITEDNFKQIWVGTGNGISRIHLDSETDRFSIINYFEDDGLICNETNLHAMLKLPSGNIIVGTPKGYEIILPQDVYPNSYDAVPYLTEVETTLAGDSLYKADRLALEQTGKLTFSYKHNSFALAFSALDMVDANRLKYAYKIEPGNGDFVTAKGNVINFSMLQPGFYTLTVKVCNAQGVWSTNERTLKIRILPPWWQSGWAYACYLLVVLAVAAALIRFVYQRQREQQRLAEYESENERQKQVGEMKLRFFANISHELRTPLSLIISPLDEFMNEHAEYKSGVLSIVRKNADYLLDLVNQLLDFRKLDAGAESTHFRHDDLLILVNEIFHSYDPLAKQSGIDYEFRCDEPELFVDFDYDKVRKSVNNILSNAFKFTPPKGSIRFTVEKQANDVCMTISDTGCGIPDEFKDKIFNRFYQMDNQNQNVGGSGIGLHIVSEYVRLHGGTVTVEDNVPTGSVFKLTLPLKQQHVEKTVEEKISDLAVEADESKPYTILLVDDNYDMVDFLKQSLSIQYGMQTAHNGKEALAIMENTDVDLIVSDVMMPEMDGIELIRAVKSDIRFSHIPIILLTAKTSEVHQMEGFHAGADDYITKPFSIDVLKLRIGKMIDSRVKRQELFSQQIKVEPSRITITPLDTQMVENAIKVVEDNINNSEFSVEDLSTGLCISRSYLYKKLIKITGKTPVEFIRTIRMKRAQQLLLESQMQVAEIAYTLGYNSPKVFSKHFKEEFGVNPSTFLKDNVK